MRMGWYSEEVKKGDIIEAKEAEEEEEDERWRGRKK